MTAVTTGESAVAPRPRNNLSRTGVDRNQLPGFQPRWVLVEAPWWLSSPCKLCNRFFFRKIVWIGVSRTACVPIVKDASKKMDPILRKALLYGKQCFASRLSGSSDEHDPICHGSNHASISERHGWRSIYENEVVFPSPHSEKRGELE